MDMINYSCIFAVFLYLFLGAFLLYKRFSLGYVGKGFLTSSFVVVNLFSFLTFLICYLSCVFLNNSFIQNFNYFYFDNLEFNFSLMLNKQNLAFALYYSGLGLIFSIFLKKYFKLKKEFIFTRQRFYTFLYFAFFALFSYLISANIAQAALFWFFISVLIYYYSHFDLFKSNTDYNNTRFWRINLVGDFSLLVFVLILYKAIALSNGYLDFSSLNFENLNLIFSYCYGILPVFEFKILLLSLLIAIATRLFILPFNCYFSFLTNASNLFYIICATVLNTSFGAYLLYKTGEIFSYSINTKYITLIAILTILTSLFLILFEKSLKIIFGYFIASINSLFLILYFYNHKIAILAYFALNLTALISLIIFFKKDKISLHSRLINKQKGFILEKLNITLFETIPSKISTIFVFLDEKIFKYIFILLTQIINFVIKLLIFKVNKIKPLNNSINALILFLIFVVISVIIAIFWGYKC